MSAAEQYALTTMTISPLYYKDFRHWLKRHGWLMVYHDWLNDYYVFGRIDPTFAGQEVQAFFSAPYRNGVKFEGYVSR